LKHRASNIIRAVMANFYFQSFGEYKTMLEHFNPNRSLAPKLLQRSGDAVMKCQLGVRYLMTVIRKKFV
jgi:hypothetical protein